MIQGPPGSEKFLEFFGPRAISFGPWTSAPGVKRLSNGHFILLFQIIDLNKSPPFEINSDVPSLPIKIVNQLENDTILIGYSRYVKIISKSGKLKPARKLRSEIGFDFDIEAAVCLPDSVLGFHKHGLQGRSYKDESITQELNDPNKSFKLLCGIGKYDVTMTSSRGSYLFQTRITLYFRCYRIGDKDKYLRYIGYLAGDRM